MHAAVSFYTQYIQHWLKEHRVIDAAMCSYQSVSISQCKCTWQLFAYPSLEGTQDYVVIRREICSSAIITPSENMPKCYIINAFYCASTIFVRLFFFSCVLLFILRCCLWTPCVTIPLTVQINETYSWKLVLKKKIIIWPFSSCGIACHFTLLQLYVLLLGVATTLVLH